MERIRLAILVFRFAWALWHKLCASEKKYGWSGAWRLMSREINNDHLRRHIEKGDPRDVAAYCAFAWYHDWRLD